MPSLNKSFIMGHLSRDPQLKYLPSQTALVEFGVACNRKYKAAGGEQREDVLFLDCAAFGKTAETINQYFKKGAPIFIEGRLKYDQWEDKNGGGKRSKISLVVENFQFIGGDQGKRSQPNEGGHSTPNPIGEGQELDPESIPF